MSMVRIIAKPNATALTTPAAVVLFMGEGDPTAPRLAALIDVASDAVVGACQGRVFGRQQVEETFHATGERPDQWRSGGWRSGNWNTARAALALSFAPIVSIESLIEDDTMLDPTQFEFDAPSGLLYRLTGEGDDRRLCFGHEVIVSYTAGWLLPGEEDRDFPSRYETATILTVVNLLRGAGRDPTLRSVTTEGVGSYAYDNSAGLVPATALTLLANAILQPPISA